jgi:glycosyltransferase involved in cell wall biosynthesis
MRVAVYHNLPPGGALRLLWEFVRRTCDENEYDLFSIDMGRADLFRYANDRVEQRDFASHVAHQFHFPLYQGFAGHLSLGKLESIDVVRRIRLVDLEIAAHINQGRYDVAYVHPCRLTQSPSVLRYLAIPSLYYMHETRRRSFEAGYGSRPKFDGSVRSAGRWAVAGSIEGTLRRRDALAVRSADRIACNSYYTAESIRSAYGRDADVCYPGVDEAIFDLNGNSGRVHPPEAICVGGIDRVKAHDVVIRALAMLPPGDRPLLNLVYERCDKGYLLELQALAASVGVALRLHRGIGDSALAALYRSCSVTVLCARLEPFGLVALESLACGTPVVALREAGYRETINHGASGYLVDKSPAAIADGVRRVFRGELGQRSQALRESVLARWTWSTSVERQLDVLEATAKEYRR